MKYMSNAFEIRDKRSSIVRGQNRLYKVHSILSVFRHCQKSVEWFWLYRDIFSLQKAIFKGLRSESCFTRRSRYTYLAI